MTLPLKECLREARSIQCFSGQDDYALSTYLRDLESVLSLTSADVQPMVQRILANKLRGRALQYIETLIDPTFDQIIEKLKEEFGVKTTFLNMRNEAMNVAADNIQELHDKLSSILKDMNTKFHLNGGNDILYTPANNELIIFEVYADFLPCHIKTLLLQNNINTINKAYNYFVINNVLKDIQITKKNSKNGQMVEKNKNTLNQNNRNHFNGNSYYNKNRSYNNKNINNGMNYVTQRTNVDNVNNSNYNNIPRNFDANHTGHYRNTGNVNHGNSGNMRSNGAVNSWPYLNNNNTLSNNRVNNSGNYRQRNANQELPQQQMDAMETDNLETYQNFRLSPLNPDYP